MTSVLELITTVPQDDLGYKVFVSESKSVKKALLEELGPERYYRQFPEDLPTEPSPNAEPEAVSDGIATLFTAIHYVNENPGVTYEGSRLYAVAGRGEVRSIEEGKLEVLLKKAQQVGGEEVSIIHLKARVSEPVHMEGDVSLVVGVPSTEEIMGYPIHQGYALLISQGGHGEAYLAPEMVEWTDTLPTPTLPDEG